jgi:hypothetical protein
MPDYDGIVVGGGAAVISALSANPDAFVSGDATGTDQPPRLANMEDTAAGHVDRIRELPWYHSTVSEVILNVTRDVRSD